MQTCAQPPDRRLSGRVVVVSPHFDDAVLSLGATMAAAVQHGAAVEILTVFGYDPASNAVAGPWDLKSGFATEGDAASARRIEDKEACAILGATPRWLNFGAEPYHRCGSDEQIWSAVAAITSGADTVLVPGYPLQHADHADLTRLLLQRHPPCRQLALYAEQPYSFEIRQTPRDHAVATPLAGVVTDSSGWINLPTSADTRRIKFRAIQAYRSQLRSLGLRQTGRGYLRLRYLLWYEARHGGESVAWLNAT